MEITPKVWGLWEPLVDKDVGKLIDELLPDSLA